MENENVQTGSYDAYKGREYFKQNILTIMKLQVKNLTSSLRNDLTIMMI
jgi:hypothetical protein